MRVAGGVAAQTDARVSIDERLTARRAPPAGWMRIYVLARERARPRRARVTLEAGLLTVTRGALLELLLRLPGVVIGISRRARRRPPCRVEGARRERRKRRVPTRVHVDQAQPLVASEAER